MRDPIRRRSRTVRLTWLAMSIAVGACGSGEPSATPAIDQPLEEGGEPPALDRIESPSQILVLQLEILNTPVTDVVRQFVDQAAASSINEADAVRASLNEVSGNDEVADALLAEVNASISSGDNERAVVATRLLGSQRNEEGLSHLMSLVELPVPEVGTIVDGQILESARLGAIQTAAVSGIGYMRSAQSNAYLLSVAQSHDLATVRAEAAFSYVYNNGSTPQAREQVREYLDPGESSFADRIGRFELSGAEFDAQLDAYYTAHPEDLPPEPGQSTNPVLVPTSRW